MAQKGVNTIILETKGNILEAVNNGIRQGLPISIISILVENIMLDVEKNLNNVIEKENKEYQEQIQVESEQILYEEPSQEEFN